MALQLLISFAPFFALLYVLFAFVQALRHKQQGVGAALLALVALVVPLAAYILASTTVLQALILTRLALNAMIVFVASLLVGLIERRNKARTPGRSYAMLGIGLSVVFALVMFAAPLLTVATTTETAAAEQTASQTVSRDNTLVNVSDVRNTTVDDPAAQATSAADTDSAEPTAVALVLSEQTGLTVDEITAQVEAGSTLADLIAANDGDLDAAVTAIASALDEMVAAGGMQAQMLSRFGTDTMEIATQFVQGELGQAQQFLLPVLLTGTMPQFGSGPGGNGGGAPPADGSVPPDGFVPPDAEVTAESTVNAPVARPPRDTAAQATAEPIATDVPLDATEPTATGVPEQATEPVIRPTRIAFPTAMPTVEAAEATANAALASATETTDDAESASASNAVPVTTCLLVVNYNLNVRNQPTAEGSTVLVSIPFGTTVNADQVTADGWYSVSYDGTSGWVTGEYVTPSASCMDLPVAS